MSQTPDDLDLIIVDLIQARLAKGDDVFVFTTGNLRGKLVSARCVETIPAPTFLPGGFSDADDDNFQLCVSLQYIPRPRSHDANLDPARINFTRKQATFVIPTRLINSALFLQKLADKMWMLNVVTSVKE